MPVLGLNKKGKYPEWSEVNHYGINYLKTGDIVEMHYHDGNEYWII